VLALMNMSLRNFAPGLASSGSARGNTLGRSLDTAFQSDSETLQLQVHRSVGRQGRYAGADKMVEKNDDSTTMRLTNVERTRRFHWINSNLSWTRT